MAELLGAQAVINSLQADVKDIQSAITEVFSRTGPIQMPSWKFPDKMSCDLDIEDLLDLYSYSDEEEERQVAHIALYELVIDRLVLLIQSMSVYVEKIAAMTKSDCDVRHSSSSSVGLVVKRYWSRLVHLYTAVKSSVAENKSKINKISELELTVSRLNIEAGKTLNNNRPRTVGLGGLIPPNRAELALGVGVNPDELHKFGIGISKDEYNKASQTNETAFVPCESCSIVQKSYQKTGDMVISMCQSQSIPSCLQKFRSQVSHLDWLSGNDVARWSSEQNKDLTRLSKIMATVQPLKSELKENEQKCEQLQKRVTNFDRDLKREKDDHEAIERQYETKLKQMNSRHTQELELERNEKESLSVSKQELERILKQHKQELKEQQNLLAELDKTKERLEEELSLSKSNKEEVSRLEAEVSDLQTKMDAISSNMEKSTRELSREQAKNKSASKHSQSLQSKQESLLQRLDELDLENSDLREQVAELEEEKETVAEKIDSAQREAAQWQKKVKDYEVKIEDIKCEKENLEQSIATLEKTIESLENSLEESKERERMLVEYPDVNGPVNRDLTGTGDIAIDMENQVKANCLRIELLEDQNEGLRNSISKVLAMQQQQAVQQHASYVQSTGPKPLWNTTYLEQRRNQGQYSEPNNQSNNATNDCGYGNQSTSAYKFDNVPVQHNIYSKTPFPEKEKLKSGSKVSNKSETEEFLVGRAMRPDSAAKRRTATSSTKTRPSSGKAPMVPVNTSSIGAYIQLKKAGKLGTSAGQDTKPAGTRPTSAKKPVSVPQADRDITYTCDRCDKMYTRARDLEIHHSYCTA